MAVLKALQRTPGTLWRNPVLFVPLIVILVLQAPTFATEWLDPVLAVVISLGVSVLFVFLMPFFQGGIIGMTEEALRGRTSLGRFVQSGKANYLSIFGAYLLLLGVNIGFGVVVAGAVILGAAGAYLGGGDAGGVTAIVFVGIGVLVLLAYLLVNFFVQFYGQAIVIDDHGAIGGLKHSIGLVRRNLVSTFGYAVLATVIGGGFGIVGVIVSIVVRPRPFGTMPVGSPPVEWMVGFGVAVALVSVVVGAFFGVYTVAFYQEISAERSGASAQTLPE